VIIDCHGHYTTAPPAVGAWRDAQLAAVEANSGHVLEKGSIQVSDDEIRESLETAQLPVKRQRGIDLTLFSPRASWMGHHLGNPRTSLFWSQHQNELIRRVCDLYPDDYSPVCQLPQSPGATLESAVEELERCVLEMGFVGCNVNPDPSGGMWTGPPLSDSYWAPLWEKMCELDVPAMIHVSASGNENLDTTGSYYLGADTTAFMQTLISGFANGFPGLRLIIPHGGGAVPYHWGRLRGMAADKGWDFDAALEHIYFDTCVYHQRGIDLLLDVVPVGNILFGTEMVGAVQGIDPATGRHWDDTGHYIESSSLAESDKTKIYETNARSVFPRLRPAVGKDEAVDT
jgi:4-oxalmesaconate hydratase